VSRFGLALHIPTASRDAPATAQPNNRVWAFVLAAVFVTAAGWRLAGITVWPVAYDGMLQYENTLTARRLFMRWRPTPLSAGEAAWLEGTSGARVKGPPVMESLLASLWLLSGRERPWLGGLITSGFWLLAAGLLHATSVRLLRDRAGPVAGTAWFLVTPYGILMSRVFQHEAALMAGIAWALYRLLEPSALKTWRGAFLNGALAGAGLLIKPGMGLPVVAGAALGQVLSPRIRGPEALRRGALFLVLAALPSFIYAGLFLHGETHQIIPHLLATRMMWAGWASQIGQAAGWVPFLGGVVGSWLLWQRRRSLLAFGLLGGYVAQGLVLTWAAATHAYYHLPVLIPVALGLSASVSHLTGVSIKRGFGALVGWGTLAIVATYAAIGPLPIRQALTDRSGERTASTLATIGRELGVGTRVIGLDRGYGFQLAYQWLIVRYWPSSVDLYYEQLRTGKVLRRRYRLGRYLESFAPSYFVVTAAEDWRAQPGLEAFLRERYPLVREDPLRGVWIFDLRSGKDRGSGAGASGPATASPDSGGAPRDDESRPQAPGAHRPFGT